MGRWAKQLVAIKSVWRPSVELQYVANINPWRSNDQVLRPAVWQMVSCCDQNDYGQLLRPVVDLVGVATSSVINCVERATVYPVVLAFSKQNVVFLCNRFGRPEQPKISAWNLFEACLGKYITKCFPYGKKLQHTNPYYNFIQLSHYYIFRITRSCVIMCQMGWHGSVPAHD